MVAATSESTLPEHIAIIMDGNGRWAQSRGLPRTAGHRAGVKAVRASIEYCARKRIKALTLFAFSSENWQRPKEEVGLLMSLFLEALDREIADLHKNNIRVRFIGERKILASELLSHMTAAESLTEGNTGLNVVIAFAYGGRWDIAQAARALAQECIDGKLNVADIDENKLGEHMALKGLPDPDLFIRTGGDQRISNFLLWNLAYTELFFVPELWPEFGEQQLNSALHQFAQRERRYGLTSEQANMQTGRH